MLYFQIASLEKKFKARKHVIIFTFLSLALKFILFCVFVLHFTKEYRGFFISIVITVCQYFYGDNIDPVFTSSSTLSSIFSRCRSVTRLDSSVLLLFSSRFSFPEQRLNGEATTRTIRRASCVIESPSSSFLFCLAFISSPFAIASVTRYRSTVEKITVFCLVGVFFTVSFSRDTNAKATIFRVIGVAGSIQRNCLGKIRFQVSTLRLFAIIVC